MLENVPRFVAEENEGHEKIDTSYSLYGFIRTLLIISAVVLAFLFFICLDLCRKTWKNGSRIDQPSEVTPFLKSKQRNSSKGLRPTRMFCNGNSPRSKRISVKQVLQEGGKKCQPICGTFRQPDLDHQNSNQKQIISILKKHKYVHFHKDTKPVDITSKPSSRNYDKHSSSFPGEFRNSQFFNAKNNQNFLKQPQFLENDLFKKYASSSSGLDIPIRKFQKSPNPKMGLLRPMKFVQGTDFQIEVSKPLDQIDCVCPSTTLTTITVSLSSSSSSSSLLSTSSSSSSSSYTVGNY